MSEKDKYSKRIHIGENGSLFIEESYWKNHSNTIEEIKKLILILTPDLYKFHDSQKCGKVRIKLVERILKLEELLDRL
tara:strand:- start:1738 stop:1971 length:234 start_codon:yes stop_codon:yes gene_type:complete